MAKGAWLFAVGIAVGAVPTYIAWKKQTRELTAERQPLIDEKLKLARDNHYLQMALNDGGSGRYNKRDLMSCIDNGATRYAAIGVHIRGGMMAPQETAAFIPLRPIVTQNPNVSVSSMENRLLTESRKLSGECIDGAKATGPLIPK